MHHATFIKLMALVSQRKWPNNKSAFLFISSAIKNFNEKVDNRESLSKKKKEAIRLIWIESNLLIFFDVEFFGYGLSQIEKPLVITFQPIKFQPIQPKGYGSNDQWSWVGIINWLGIT